MVDYTNIPDAQIDQDRPVTKSLMRALRDNLLAVIAGVDNAPRISPKAIGGFSAGTYLLHTNAAPVQMTNSSGLQKWKETLVAHDGTYTAKFTYGVSAGYGAEVQLFVGDTAIGSKQAVSGSGEISADVTVKAGQSVQVRGNGGSAGGASGAAVSNLRLYADQPLDFASVS
ncbi:hypothetical protein [Methylobacterium sp. Gmos1]